MRRVAIPIAVAAAFSDICALAPAQGPASVEEAAANGSAVDQEEEPQDDRFLLSQCDSARAAGAAPLHRGEPGYRPPLDRDEDGVACEPYRGDRGRPRAR